MSIEIFRGDRDRIQGLFSGLLKTSTPDLTETSGATRLVGIAALNLVEEHSAQALFEVARVLPWLAIYRLWEGGAGVAEVAQTLIAEGLVRHHSEAALCRRLQRAHEERPSSIRRVPGMVTMASDDALAKALQALFNSEQRLEAFKELPLEQRCDALFNDSELLASVVELEIKELLPPWPIEKPAQALEAFASFEAAEFSSAPAELGQLGERSLRFVASLAEHLQSHELLAPIRAALAFAPLADNAPIRTSVLRAFLARSSLFAADAALMDLTLALIQCRHRALVHLSGGAALSIMTPWIEYLRGACAEFGESRGLTLREATSFAHYSLHMINLFDLAVFKGAAPNEELRRALLDLDDELKEFALAGQRAGLTDRQADLHRYEQMRWQKGSPFGYLADRLARLCGAWKQGRGSSSPPGGATALQGALVKDCHTLIADLADSPELDRLQSLLITTRFIGHHWLSEFSPEAVLHLLAITLTIVGRHAGGQNGPDLVVDLRPLGDWLTQGAVQERREILEFLLSQRPLAEVVSEPTGPGKLGLIVVEDQAGSVLISMPRDAQFEALLTLLASAGGDEELVDLLSRRLRVLLQESSSESKRSPEPPLKAHEQRESSPRAENELAG